MYAEPHWARPLGRHEKAPDDIIEERAAQALDEGAAPVAALYALVMRFGGNAALGCAQDALSDALCDFARDYGDDYDPEAASVADLQRELEQAFTPKTALAYLVKQISKGARQ